MRNIGVSIIVAIIACLAARGLLWMLDPDIVIAWWAYVIGFCLCIAPAVARAWAEEAESDAT